MYMFGCYKVVMSTPMHLPKISIILMTSLMDHFGNTNSHQRLKCQFTPPLYLNKKYVVATCSMCQVTVEHLHLHSHVHVF